MLSNFERDAILEAFTELCIKHDKITIVNGEFFVLAEPELIVDSITAGVEQALVEKMIEPVLDARGVPTAACPRCGEMWLEVLTLFDEDTYEIAAWATEGTCSSCGAMITICCPVDKDSEIG